jgi:hypothetical protein
MAEINGYLIDPSGNSVGTSTNPIVITITATQPQSFHPVHQPIIYLENIGRFRVPKSFIERVWQNIGKKMKWDQP